MERDENNNGINEIGNFHNVSISIMLQPRPQLFRENVGLPDQRARGLSLFPGCVEGLYVTRELIIDLKYELT